MSENITKTIKSFVVTKEELEKRKMEKFDKLFQAATEKLQEGFNELVVETEKHIGFNDIVFMGKKDVWYYPCVVAVLPNMDTFTPDRQRRDYNWQYDNGWNNKFNGFKGTLPTKYEADKFFRKVGFYRDDKNYRYLKKNNYSEWLGCGFFVYDNNKRYAYSCYNDAYYVVPSSSGNNYSNDDNLLIPIFRLHGENSIEISAAETLLLWIEHGLEPGGNGTEKWFTDNKDIKRAYKKLAKVYTENKAYLIVTEDGISLNKNAILNDIRAGKNPACLGFDAVALFTNDDIEVDEDYLNEIKEQYLSCDEKRADIDKYDAKLLTDINRGHWDLWDYDKQFVDVEIGGNVVVPGGMIARNPWSDVQEGVVAIDFGTKSTVVVYGEGALNNQPLQVGNGNYATEEEKNKYENPTVIRFKDIESFRNAYDCKVGRPLTKWEDVCVSHTAFEDMMKTNEANYNSFMNNLKQWCSNPKFKVKLEDGNKASLDLPNFLDVKAEDLNPVEVYAYYIGSYLNNMLGTPKIYKHYIMSFPVTFDYEIREKVLESFKVGLIKSLPVSLVKDEKFMADFTVEEGATEPAAYAATALTELEYDTDELGDVYYGVVRQIK